MIVYVKGNKDDIFRLTRDEDVLVHACNSRGIWGAGIALQFKKQFPIASRIFTHWCEANHYNVVGKCLVVVDHGRVIGNLVTSHGYGWQKDSENKILTATYNSIRDLFQQIPVYRTVVSPRINNGLFGVPWEYTEGVIRKAIGDSGFDIEWRVHTID
jgi:ADP-ribose 1''-phosphate phosphatase